MANDRPSSHPGAESAQRELGLTHANASYHLRVLLDAGELVIDGEEKIRGGLAKRYRYPHERRGKHSQDNHDPEPDDRVSYARAVGLEIERRIRHHESKGVHSDLEGWVPPEIWERACRLLTEASFLLHDHNAPPRTPGTVHVSSTSWAFQMSEERQP